MSYYDYNNQVVAPKLTPVEYCNEIDDANDAQRIL